MIAEHKGNFDLGDKYGAVYLLEDGTFVNIVTVWEGPGLGCGVEFEAGRPLTKEELNTLSDFDSGVDHAKKPKIQYTPREIQHRW